MADKIEDPPISVTIPIVIEMNGTTVRVGEIKLLDNEYGRVHFRGMNLQTLMLEGVLFELQIVPTTVFHTG